MGHAYHGQQGQLLPLGFHTGRRPAVLAGGHVRKHGYMHPFLQRFCVLLIFAGVAAELVRGQRERTRPNWNSATTVTEAQASELTLTVTETAVRPIQVWVRTAGVIDAARRVVTATVPAADGIRIRVGQRVRAFSPESRSRMYQANVTQVVPHKERVTLQATVEGQTLDASRHFVLEIVTENDEFLSVPNEAILESGGKQLVYVQNPEGRYAPREIKVGLRGELFTQVLDGLAQGQQVVTIGSFFIDAEHRLKGS